MNAHQTLILRAFFRQFRRGEVPKDYYDYLAGGISREVLWSNHRAESKSADQEAWHAELGGESTPDQLIDERISQALAGRRDWLLIGGPPCQAYSVVGRSRVIGGEGLEKYEADPRHGLYRHYLRIIQKHRPAVFVMENVKGLLSAKIGQKKHSSGFSPTSAIPNRRSTAGPIAIPSWNTAFFHSLRKTPIFRRHEAGGFRGPSRGARNPAITPSGHHRRNSWGYRLQTPTSDSARLRTRGGGDHRRPS